MKDRKVDAEEAKAYASENGLLYLDTSARTGLNVKELFVAIAKKLPKVAKGKAEDVIPDLGEAPTKKGSGGSSGSGCC